MRSYVDISIVMQKITFIAYLQGMVVSGMGTAMLVWRLSNRKKDEEDLLLAKFLEQTPAEGGAEILQGRHAGEGK